MTEQTVPASFAVPATADPSPGTPSTLSAAAGTVPAAAGAPLMLSAVAQRIKRPRLSVPLYLDAELAPQIDEAERALERAIEYDKTTNEPDTAPTIAQHLRDLEDAAEASKVVFVLQAVSHRDYQKLRAQFPPTAEQIEMAAKNETGEPAFDADTFAPALVCAQLVSPQVDSGEVFGAFWDELNDGQLQQLWSTALTVQMGVTDPGPKSEIASEVLRSYGTS